MEAPFAARLQSPFHILAPAANRIRRQLRADSRNPKNKSVTSNGTSCMQFASAADCQSICSRNTPLFALFFVKFAPVSLPSTIVALH